MSLELTPYSVTGCPTTTANTHKESIVYKAFKAGFKFGSPLPNANDATSDQTSKPKDCICDRPAGQIFCRSCGHVFAGRVRGHCPVHPVMILLMDIEMCPNCHSQALKEFGPTECLSSSKNSAHSS